MPLVLKNLDSPTYYLVITTSVDSSDNTSVRNLEIVSIWLENCQILISDPNSDSPKIPKNCFCYWFIRIFEGMFAGNHRFDTIHQYLNPNFHIVGGQIDLKTN